MQKITYDAKAYINENPSVPAANKVQAADLNEIKTVVNANADATHNWIELGTKTGAVSMTLPNDYKEILVLMKIGGLQNLFLSILIPEIFISQIVGTMSFNSGYYRGASINAMGRVSVSSTSIVLNEAWYNGNTDALSTTQWVVYYR